METTSQHPYPADDQPSLFHHNSSEHLELFDDYELLFDDPQQQQQQEPQPPMSSASQVGQSDDEYVDPDDTKRTISMTVLFLVLMVLYIGFCFYYRRGKSRRLVGDYYDGEEGGDGRRQRQRRENQEVLDESTTRANRARNNAEEQAKLEERKSAIKDALLLRLIVEEVEPQHGEGGSGDCNCEQCLYWRWDSTGSANVGAAGEEMKEEEKGENLFASTKKIITIKEEDDDHEVDCTDEEMVQQAKVSEEANDDCKDIEEKIQDTEKDAAATATSTATQVAQAPSSSPVLGPIPSPSPPSSPRPPCLSMLGTTAPTTPPTSPYSPRLSLSSPKKYIDELNCANRDREGHRENSGSRGGRSYYTDALNCGNNVVRHAIHNCSTHNVSCGTPSNCGSSHLGGSIHGKSQRKGGSNGCETISLEAVQTMYGEECNICLSQFQVGDRAAWSKEYGNDYIEAGTDGHNNNSNNACVSETNNSHGEQEGEAPKTGCTHVFHEECISRWLLVRNGCPICRRAYFVNVGSENAASNDTLDTSATSRANSAGTDSSTVISAVSGNDNEVDLERGESTGNIIVEN
mmetsp:Transcript_23636/g.50027  ORF Transcript_23636/g.50027 Transcript_23636/m.50027 type:complete len:575 (-) Transcript_23636:304-2028(-)|eukprot:CAMPEP_0183708920 /NCGR_PEP_ID=MMETSP0737-20130205/5079_1 /TAXON_ID=385413 /ORGANISM="Thalassiosira miniscula, Strain CCMP1093" /LENGTH=574 /DNA_ID=CAMNT_0025936877 /DNA_START=483 /DNA_END=2207 /DNA_ORIENTATION=-